MRFWGEILPSGDLRLYARWKQKAQDAFRPGDRLQISVDKDRNGKFNALAHLMFGKVCDAVNRGPASMDIDRLKRWVKLQTGRYEVIALPRPVNGVSHAIEYQSTAFAKMGEAEFHDFMVDACELIRDRMAPWIEDSDQWPEIQAILGSILREPA